MEKELLHECGCSDDNNTGCKDDNNSGCGGCGCGCGDHDHDSEALIVDLEDENGNIVPCEVIDSFEYKTSEYVLVQNPQDEAIYLFKVVGEGEDSELVIPEDEEFEEVTKYYDSLTDEE